MPACGKENPDGFQFCGFCAAPLTELPGGLVQEERKVVTVLFCDLVGFTAGSEAADPEDVRARIRPYHARLRQEIERYSGTVEKFIGDAVMAVFGAPVATRTTPSAPCGPAFASGCDRRAERGRPGLAPVRIGINTGEGVVALGARPEQGEGIVTGDVVNTPLGFRRGAGQRHRRLRDDFSRDRAHLRVRAARAGRGQGEGEPLALYRPLQPAPASAPT